MNELLNQAVESIPIYVTEFWKITLMSAPEIIRILSLP